MTAVDSGRRRRLVEVDLPIFIRQSRAGQDRVAQSRCLLADDAAMRRCAGKDGRSDDTRPAVAFTGTSPDRRPWHRRSDVERSTRIREPADLRPGRVGRLPSSRLGARPHPDDEILVLGGTLSRLSAQGTDLRILPVTDGEASHAGFTAWTAERLIAMKTIGEFESQIEADASHGPILPEHVVERFMRPFGVVFLSPRRRPPSRLSALAMHVHHARNAVRVEVDDLDRGTPERPVRPLGAARQFSHRP